MDSKQEQSSSTHLDALRWRALVNAFSKGDTGVWYSGVSANFCFDSPTEIEVETRLSIFLLNEEAFKKTETPEEFKARVLITWVDNIIRNKGKNNES